MCISLSSGTAFILQYQNMYCFSSASFSGHLIIFDFSVRFDYLFWPMLHVKKTCLITMHTWIWGIFHFQHFLTITKLLTKKLSVYNFNGRFIWTVRDRITTKIQKNAFQKSYKLICILMSEISIWPLRKTWLSAWWQNPCWQSQRSDVSCSWPPGLHTSQEEFCSTPLCRSSPSH